MNWLAHLVLSESTPEFRVGSVLADILPITEIRQLPDAFQGGIARHRAIDSFTDKHPVFRQSISRLDPHFRRYGAVVMDIFYDHLLTAAWQQHSAMPLDEFVTEFFADVDACRAAIPESAYGIFRRMRSGGWLTSYGDVEGVRLTLNRMSLRLRRPFDLGGAADELARHHGALEQDFAHFFPEIRNQFPTTVSNSAVSRFQAH
jgi:acyl carrier protein phosphodiesterase